MQAMFNRMLLLKLCLSSGLMCLSLNAMAGYFIAYSSVAIPVVECRYRHVCVRACSYIHVRRPCHRIVYVRYPTVYIRSTAPYRHQHINPYQMDEYRWIENP